jgi:hypothetical protein|tara:strand:+ start:611 stop:874 length:264 start_codon:yes stop_codon:yes gene_type:complete
MGKHRHFEMTLDEIIKERMNRALGSTGRTFVWNPRSRRNKSRKIRSTRLTFGGNVELTFFHPLPGKTSKLFTIVPTLDCMEDHCIID